MSKSSHLQPAAAGSLLLLGIAVIFYIPAVLAVWLGAPEDDPATLSGEGRYSEGWAILFAFVFGIPLWLALGGVAVAITAVAPLALVDKAEFPANLAAARQRWDNEFNRRRDASIKAAEQWELGINKLGPNSPLGAWLEYVNGSSDPGLLHDQALAGARSDIKRQAEAVRLLEDGAIRQLSALWQLDIEATPALCTTYDQALRRLATSDEVYEVRIGEDLERQLPNLKFLAAKNCGLEAGLAAAETRTRKLVVIYPDGNEHERWIRFLTTLGTLHRTR